MDWSHIASHYKKLLTTTLNVQRHARHIANIRAAAVQPKLLQKLTEGSDVVQRQLDRLEKGEFRIAVVGLEKSGKSTFVNAWLESDLLPTASKRCTFTTTQIYSVINSAEQRLEVIPKTVPQFDEYIKELQQAANTPETGENARRAQEDLNTIQHHRSTLDAAVREGYRTYPFAHIAEIAPRLQKYVADVTVAHAIEDVRLYTSRLAETDGIVFFDVPGLNSGLGKHLEASRSMLADCDAVICIQNSRHPSLEAHEQRLLEFVTEGDEAVGVAGKLFVFAGQIDLQGSAVSLEHDRAEICREWHQRGNLPADHIIIGSAAAYLLLKGAASDEFRQQVGETADVRAKLISVTRLDTVDGTGSDSANSEVMLLNATGIPLIRARIKRYLNEERGDILKLRCDEPIRRIMGAAREIYHTVREKFSENPDEVRRLEANRHNIAFSEWWGQRWKAIEPEVNRFYKEHYDPDDDCKVIPSVQQLHSRYQELVDIGLNELPSLQEQNIKDVFDKISPVFDGPIANDAWRKDIYSRDINAFLYNLAEQLSVEVLKDCEDYVTFMQARLWDAADVKKYMIDSRQLKLQLESGLRALFLRFARPVTEALIRGPLASETRRKIVKKLGDDIELLDNYHKGEEPAYGLLKRYVKYGLALLNDPILRYVVLNLSPVSGLAASAMELRIKDVQPELAKTREAVIEEVKGDLKALHYYLTEVVFRAAGFGAFLSQELKHLRDEFASRRDVWAGVARNEYEAENPKLLSELPEHLKKPVFDTEVSERLRQLRLALEDAMAKEV